MRDLETIAGFIAMTIMVVGVAWAPVACNNSNNAKIEAAIENGVDPIKARCAYASGPDATACAISAAKEGGGK